MSDFFKFPSTVHLASIGAVSRSDKVMPAAESRDFLRHDLIGEEKLDGANIGISKSPEGLLRIQNRGNYLSKPFIGQFSRLSSWLDIHRESLDLALEDDIIMFGEWCAAKHSIEYSSLPDLFFLFDVYDLTQKAFWSVARRDQLALRVGVEVPPRIDVSEMNVKELSSSVDHIKSRFSSALIEGVVLRYDDSLWNIRRAKVVRGDFTQSISDHWSKGTLTWNRLVDQVPSFPRE